MIYPSLHDQLDLYERMILRSALNRARFNARRAAWLLDISQATLYRLLHKHDLLTWNQHERAKRLSSYRAARAALPHLDTGD